jgi:TolA-binding protein
MTIWMNNLPFGRAILAGLAVLAVGTASAPAIAQDNGEARIRKLEAEVRALQRKVFPGGSERFFEPEITGSSGSPSNTGAPSTTAVTDILARLDALEGQIQRLTGQVEENSNSIRQLTTRIAALETGAGSATVAGAAPATMAATSTTPTSAPATNSATTASRIVAAATPSGPTAQRLAAVQQIAKPQTDDAGDDEYSYGFRLWDAGFFPEAQQQLNLFVEKYPSHWRTTYGRNLLGRAYMDDGKPRDAAPWFLKNYQTDKNGARAPDSLLYLAEAMIALGDKDRACIALTEFGETYPAIAAGRLNDQYQADKRKVSCN